LEVDYNSFLYQQSGSGERVGHFAMRRVGRIELLIGSEVIEAASDEVQTKFESEVDPELFDMFMRGEEPARNENGVAILAPIGANKGERDDISDVKRWEAVARRWILEFPPRERDWVDLKDPTWRSGENEDPNCP
jgi:hypothetical protein